MISFARYYIRGSYKTPLSRHRFTARRKPTEQLTQGVSYTHRGRVSDSDRGRVSDTIGGRVSDSIPLWVSDTLPLTVSNIITPWGAYTLPADCTERLRLRFSRPGFQLPHQIQARERNIHSTISTVSVRQFIRFSSDYLSIRK